MEIIKFKILNTAIERILNNEMSSLGITYTQATIIGYLYIYQDSEICQKNIESDLGVTHSTMSSILSRLQQKKLISTELFPTDKRFKRVFLTTEGFRLVSDIEKKIEIISKKLFNNLNEEKVKILDNFIDTLITNIK